MSCNLLATCSKIAKIIILLHFLMFSLKAFVVSCVLLGSIMLKKFVLSQHDYFLLKNVVIPGNSHNLPDILPPLESCLHQPKITADTTHHSTISYKQY